MSDLAAAFSAFVTATADKLKVEEGVRTLGLFFPRDFRLPVGSVWEDEA